MRAGERIGSILSEWQSVSALVIVVVVGSDVVSVLVLVQNIHGIYWLLSSWILLPLVCSNKCIGADVWW